MSILLFPLLALTVATPCHSQSNDDTIIVIRVLEDSKPATKTNRSSSICPVECSYYTLTDMVELSFSQNLGRVYVSLDNLSSGETNDYSCDSSLGLLRMPVTPDACYAMSITTESGRSFNASFVTVAQDSWNQ